MSLFHLFIFLLGHYILFLYFLFHIFIYIKLFVCALEKMLGNYYKYRDRAPDGARSTYRIGALFQYCLIHYVPPITPLKPNIPSHAFSPFLRNVTSSFLLCPPVFLFFSMAFSIQSLPFTPIKPKYSHYFPTLSPLKPNPPAHSFWPFFRNVSYSYLLAPFLLAPVSPNFSVKS